MRTVTVERADRRVGAWPGLVLLALSYALGASVSCTPSDPPAPGRQPAMFHARSPDGTEIAGVRVWADGRELGTTDAKGRLSATLESPPSARVAITAACPPAYGTRDERRALTLRPLHASTQRPTPARLQLSITCEPLELLTALVVRIRGERTADLPIRVRDRIVGQTGPDGTAHLLLRTRPETSLTVELETSAVAELEPRDPVQTFQLGDEPSVLVFDQTLTRPRNGRRSPRPARLPAPTRGLPYRVD